MVHAVVLLYNYYHRKHFPHLDFADPKQFALAAGDALPVHLKHGGGGAEASGIVRAIEDACGIAEALDAKEDSPQTSMWPISKVAVLLVDPTGTKCLVDYASVTEGVWSILEKDITAASGKSCSTPGSSHEMEVNSEPYKLQQAAYSEVESKTGMKRGSLRFLEEHLVYSLSKKETTAKLFVLQYQQTVDRDLKEISIEDLIDRISGPIFTNEACPEITSVVDYYHILPYKEVLLNLLNRQRSLDSSSIPKRRRGRPSLQSKKDGSLKEREANSKSNIKNTTTNASDPNKNKGMKEVGNNGTNKNRKDGNLNRKRKSEALKASPQRGNGSLSSLGAENLILLSNAANPELTMANSEGLVNVETSGQMDKNKSSGGFDNLQTSVLLDKNKTGEHSVSKSIAVDTSKVNAPEGIMKAQASEDQIVKPAEISGSIDVDQMYASLRSLQKMRNDTVRECCMLEDLSAQFDMDIQTILTEGKMTPRVISILQKYEETTSNVVKIASSTSSGEGSQTRKLKRRRLTEAVLSRTKCEELDVICGENNWILPRYTVLPSPIDGLYQAAVHLVCPDLELKADGGMKTTPCEARDSAAAAMLHQLHTKAKEKLAELDSSTPDAVQLDKIPEK